MYLTEFRHVSPLFNLAAQKSGQRIVVLHSSLTVEFMININMYALCVFYFTSKTFFQFQFQFFIFCDDLIHLTVCFDRLWFAFLWLEMLSTDTALNRAKEIRKMEVQKRTDTGVTGVTGVMQNFTFYSSCLPQSMYFDSWFLKMSSSGIMSYN